MCSGFPPVSFIWKGHWPIDQAWAQLGCRLCWASCFISWHSCQLLDWTVQALEYWWSWRPRVFWNKIREKNLPYIHPLSLLRLFSKLCTFSFIGDSSCWTSSALCHPKAPVIQLNERQLSWCVRISNNRYQLLCKSKLPNCLPSQRELVLDISESPLSHQTTGVADPANGVGYGGIVVSSELKSSTLEGS